MVDQAGIEIRDRILELLVLESLQENISHPRRIFETLSKENRCQTYYGFEEFCRKLTKFGFTVTEDRVSLD